MVRTVIDGTLVCICFSVRLAVSVTLSLELVAGGTTSEWSEKSDPIQLAGEKVSLASVATEKLKDGAVAKVASVAKVRLLYPASSLPCS